MSKTTIRHLRKRTIRNKRGRKTRRGGMFGRLKPLGQTTATIGKKIVTTAADITLEVGKNQAQQDIISKKGPISKYNKQQEFIANKSNIYNKLQPKYQYSENISPNTLNRNMTYNF